MSKTKLSEVLEDIISREISPFATWDKKTEKEMKDIYLKQLKIEPLSSLPVVLMTYFYCSLNGKIKELNEEVSEVLLSRDDIEEDDDED